MPYIKYSGRYKGDVVRPTFRPDGMVVFMLRDCKVTSEVDRFLTMYAPFSTWGLAEVALAKMGMVS